MLQFFGQVDVGASTDQRPVVGQIASILFDVFLAVIFMHTISFIDKQFLKYSMKQAILGIN
jgi:hypothetical protein